MVKADWASHRLSARLLSFQTTRRSFNCGQPMRNLAFALLLTCGLFAAEKENKPNPTFLDANAGGQDYADQGEYKNDWGAIQVIALGGGDFRAVTYRGGLPGDGWDTEYKTEASGKRDGSTVMFSGENKFRADVEKGKITIITAEGGPFTMDKTERKSPTLGAKPPQGAVVLFDGT